MKKEKNLWENRVLANLCRLSESLFDTHTQLWIGFKNRFLIKWGWVWSSSSSSSSSWMSSQSSLIRCIVKSSSSVARQGTFSLSFDSSLTVPSPSAFASAVIDEIRVENYNAIAAARWLRDALCDRPLFIFACVLLGSSSSNCNSFEERKKERDNSALMLPSTENGAG